MANHAINTRGHLMGWVFVAVSLAGAIVALSLVAEVSSGAALQISVPWVPSLGVQLSFLIDGLSLLFALLITSIGAFVGLYATAYMAGQALTGRFFFYLLAFQISMLGLVLADNIITLFVFWELTTVTSSAPRTRTT